MAGLSRALGLSPVAQAVSSNIEGSELDFTPLYSELSELDKLENEFNATLNEYQRCDDVLVALQTETPSERDLALISAALGVQIDTVTLQSVKDSLKDFGEWLKKQLRKLLDKIQKVWDYFFEGFTVLNRKAKALKKKLEKANLGNIKDKKVDVTAGNYRYFQFEGGDLKISTIITKLDGLEKATERASKSEVRETIAKKALELVKDDNEINVLLTSLVTGTKVDDNGTSKILIQALPGNYAIVAKDLSTLAPNTPVEKLKAISSYTTNVVNYPFNYKTPTSGKVIETPERSELESLIEGIIDGTDTCISLVQQKRDFKGFKSNIEKTKVEIDIENESDPAKKRELENKTRAAYSAAATFTVTFPLGLITNVLRVTLPCLKAYYQFAKDCLPKYAKQGESTSNS